MKHDCEILIRQSELQFKERTLLHQDFGIPGRPEQLHLWEQMAVVGTNLCDCWLQQVISLCWLIEPHHQVEKSVTDPFFDLLVCGQIFGLVDFVESNFSAVFINIQVCDNPILASCQTHDGAAVVAGVNFSNAVWGENQIFYFVLRVEGGKRVSSEWQLRWNWKRHVEENGFKKLKIWWSMSIAGRAQGTGPDHNFAVCEGDRWFIWCVLVLSGESQSVPVLGVRVWDSMQSTRLTPVVTCHCIHIIVCNNGAFEWR